MLDILYKIEQISVNFSSTTQLSVGMVFGLVGICVWLGGLGFEKISSVVIGTSAGCVCGYLIKSHVIMLIVFSTLAGCVASLLLEKVSTTILGYGTAAWNFVHAGVYSIFGTIFIFSGMILLLTYKGTGPVKNIAQKQMFYALVLVAMVVFGTVVQLLLCRHSQKKQIPGQQDTENKRKETSKIKDWRNF